MLGWWRRRRMGDAARRRMVIALARAEEDLVETHVRNVLDLFDAVGDDLPLSQTLEIYLDEMDVTEPRASIVARRVMARFEAGAAKTRKPKGPAPEPD